MQLTGRIDRGAVLATAALGGVIAMLAAAAGADAAATFQPLPGCTYRANVSAIIDDSGSTSETDPSKLRAAGLKYFMARQLSTRGLPPRVLSAVQFGESASTIFEPTQITRESVPPMSAALDAAIQADDGGTNYNAAFAFDNQLNPSHDARIFFTDGMHNEGEYENGHRPGPKTDVLGLNVTESELLDRITADTGGFQIPLDDASQVPVQMDSVFSDLSCIAPPEQTSFAPPQPGETKTVLRTPVGQEDQSLNLAIFTGELPSGDFRVSIKDSHNVVHHVFSQFNEATTSATRGVGCGSHAANKARGAKKRFRRAERGLRSAKRRHRGLRHAARRLRKAKKKLRWARRHRPTLHIKCSADTSFLLMDLSAKKGKGAVNALGKKLRVRVTTDDGAYISSESPLTASLTRNH